MMRNNLSVSKQLYAGFIIILSLVVISGAFSYHQESTIYSQVETLYINQLKVRRALMSLNNDILSVRISLNEMVSPQKEQELLESSNSIKAAVKDAERQLDILRSTYMGPASDVDKLIASFSMWEAFVEQNQTYLKHNEYDNARDNLSSTGTFSVYQKNLTEIIDTISAFASRQSDTIYSDAARQKSILGAQFLLFMLASFSITLIIGFTLSRNIRRPLEELNTAVQRFQDGDMDSRSKYLSANEFGVLASSINRLADLVQSNTQIHNMRSSIVDLMLSEDDRERFFRSLLGILTELTGAQIAAVYLLNRDKRQFEHFDSIGLDCGERAPFSAESFEGEFGVALYAKKIRHIKGIHGDTRVTYRAVSGTFVPREIITVPIVSGGKVIAVISLASLSELNPLSAELLEVVYVTMCTRISDILSYEEIKGFQLSLERQNKELEEQRVELVAQASEMLQQNTELELQKRQLNEASRLKTNFLSNMSHELRTPLNSIIALSSVLSRRLKDKIQSEEHGYLDIIERNGKNLLLLINDILDISRIESGREDMEIANFSLCELVDETVTMLQAQAAHKKIKLSFENPPVPELYINSDRKKCSHILQNLIGNAVKFTEKGAVSVTLQKSGDNFELRVADTGIGISAEDLPHIFDEFRQADSSISKRYGGTGLGLSIVQKYVDMLGGSVLAVSELNRGSVFTVTLPVMSGGVADALDALYPPPMLEESCALNNEKTDKTILLVDDNEFATMQIRDLILEMGFNVLIAHSAEESFALIEQKVPDAMVLDIMMPDIDGLKLLEMLRNEERTANIPVLVLTAKHITKEELKFLKRNNVHQLIQKGDVDPAKLKSAITLMLYPEILHPSARPERREVIGRPVVLIAEDNPDNMTTMKALLDADYTLLEAADGEKCIETAVKHVPDLILMDIALPVKDGIEAFFELRESPLTRHIPVVAVTSSALLHDRAKILAQGFDAFVAKPIEEQELKRVIREVLYGK